MMINVKMLNRQIEVYSTAVLQKEIEEKRKEMFVLAEKLGLQSPEVLIVSKELDKLIAQYQTNSIAEK
ncbi:aspartyl-phosphate phosphatase Spo0E family protein [Bacillus niameyensis]|uniref:aspartyl-phosphate phosphatase Spo0E family protein n=1 Tax=Bacillus niameyensis TaxID=1522308 RepID=UPI000781A103|nr:aspartyl-phosphate phosphatase Spo0E family protein [Bacillus niameyensis]